MGAKKKREKRDKIPLFLTSIIEVVNMFCIVHLNKVNFKKRFDFSFSKLDIYIFLCPHVWNQYYNLLSVDSSLTTTPRMTITTKSPGRGIANFVPFLAIPGVGLIIIIIIIIIIFLPMSTMGPVKTGWFRRVTDFRTSRK